MHSKKPRLAAISDRVRLARLTRVELERLLARAKQAFEAFGTSAGTDDGDEDKSSRYAKRPSRSAPAAV